MKKLIIAGGRDFNDYNLMCAELDIFLSDNPDFTIIISGMAKGADSLGTRYAKEHDINLIEMPANWNKFGRSAGYRRNEEMAKVADGCVCFWDDRSRGTGHMIDLSIKYGIHSGIVHY